MESKTGNIIIWTGIFIVLFFGSLGFFFRSADRMDFRVIFFPDESTHEWKGEERKVPHRTVAEDAVHALIKEMILGPTELLLIRALPKDTVVRSVLLRGEVLYVDFSEHLAVSGSSVVIPFDTMLEGVRRTVLYNFPSIEKVVVFISGTEAG
ncbi:MAG: hypothetical protein CMN78_01905 [Spirochaetales bacterium]|nr:hypothetical protein [Spirochaetales bacterium]